MLGLECATHRNLSKSIQNQTESLGEAPAGLLISRHASRGNYSKIKFKNYSRCALKSLGVRLRHTYSWDRSSSEKLFKNLIQKLIALRAEIIWVRACGTLVLGSLFEREINQKLSLKINQKFIREHRWCSLLGVPYGQKSIKNLIQYLSASR